MIVKKKRRGNGAHVVPKSGTLEYPSKISRHWLWLGLAILILIFSLLFRSTSAKNQSSFICINSNCTQKNN